MLLPGQHFELSLEDGVYMSFMPQLYHQPYHFTAEEIKSIVVMPQIPGLVFLQTPLTTPVWHGFVSENASNMEIRGDVVGNYTYSNWLPKGLGYSLSMLAILSMLYGDLHATSWNGQFPTTTKQLLWRISSCIVAGGG